jgi:hypothetical protein
VTRAIFAVDAEMPDCDGDTIALWPFDEAADTVVHDIVGGNDLTMVDATWEQTGPACR